MYCGRTPRHTAELPAFQLLHGCVPGTTNPGTESRGLLASSPAAIVLYMQMLQHLWRTPRQSEGVYMAALSQTALSRVSTPNPCTVQTAAYQ